MIRFLQSGNKAAKYLLSGFLLIICLGMVVYLIPGFMQGADVTQSGVVATIGGQDILSAEVNKAVAQQMQQGHYPEMFAPYVAQQVTHQLIQGAEMAYEARRLGLKVSDEEVREELRTGPGKETFFPGGKWLGQQKYEELLRDHDLTPEAFEKQLRDGLLTRKLLSAVTASVAVSPAEVEQAYKDQNTKVKIEYTVLDLSDVLKQVKPTDAELKAYYEANKARYLNSIPEKRQVHYFALSNKDVQSKVTVDAGDLQRYYSLHQDEYRMPERVRVRHILIKTPPAGPDGKVDPKAVDEARAKAQEVLKQIKAGGNWNELAKKYSGDPGSADKGGELGWIVKGQTVPEFEKTAFGQNVGQISDPVQTMFGFHVIQTEEKEPARVKPLSEVKAQIEPIIKSQKASTLLNQDATDALAAAQKDGIDKAAAKFGVQAVQSNPIGRGDALPGVGASPDLMNAIFTAKVNDPPQLANTQQAYVIYRVTKIDPARTPSFEEIKAKVAGDFNNERGTQLLRKKMQELADRAHAEHDLAKAAKEAGLALKTSDLVGRTSQVPDLGAMGGPASVAFNMKPGEISGPLNLGQKQAVLKVVDRQEPSLTDEAFAKQRDQLTEQLTQQKRQEALDVFMGDLDSRLSKEGKVKINKGELNNLTKARG